MSNDNTNKIHEIDIELQKLDVLINELEVAEKTDETIEEYLKLKEQYKELLNKRKALVPKKKTFWDKIPLWMYIYIVIQFILLAIPYLSQLIWVYFSSWLTEVFQSQLDQLLYANISPVWFTIVLISLIYSLPIINLFISWVLYVNVVHDPFEKKVFRYIWIAQGVLTLIIGVVLFVQIILPTI